MNDTFDSFFLLQPPYLHVVACSILAVNPLLREVGRNQQITLRVIDGKRCKSLDGLFSEFAKQLEFPDYFGRNWAAFDECMNDLEWIEASGYLLVIKNAHFLLQKDDHSFEVLMRILHDTTQEWVNGRSYDSFPTEPMPFHVVFLCSPQQEEDFVKRLSTHIHASFSRHII